MSFPGNKDLGVNLDLTHTSAQHTLGLRVLTNDGKEFRYVVAGGDITANAPVKIATAHSATVSGNAGRVDGVAPVAIASGSYGFIQTRGECSVDAATDVDAGDFIANVTDASGRVTEVALTSFVIGVGLVDESANIAGIRLF